MVVIVFSSSNSRSAPRAQRTLPGIVFRKKRTSCRRPKKAGGALRAPLRGGRRRPAFAVSVSSRCAEVRTKRNVHAEIGADCAARLTRPPCALRTPAFMTLNHVLPERVFTHNDPCANRANAGRAGWWCPLKWRDARTSRARRAKLDEQLFIRF